MDTKFPRLIEALNEAIAAMPYNEALRAHLNWLLMGESMPGAYPRLRLVTAEFEPAPATAALAAAR